MSQTAFLESTGAGRLRLRAQDGASRIRMAALMPLIFSVLIMLAALLGARGMDASRIVAMVPRTPAFWMAFAAFYLTGPFSEWVIFHRLWRLPVGGIAPLLRKLVCNELLFGYLGEAYLYTWARKRSAMTAAPFAAIKDVSIMSAMAGNAVTLILLIAAVPFMGSTSLGLENRSVLLSLGIVLMTSIAAMFLRRRVFSLPRRDLAFILRTHLVRIVATTLLSAMLWRLALPGVPASSWLTLSAFRLLVSRLPLVPNKDVAFAGFAVLILGHETNIAALMTMIASLVVMTHVIVGLMLVGVDLAGNMLGRSSSDQLRQEGRLV